MCDFAIPNSLRCCSGKKSAGFVHDCLTLLAFEGPASELLSRFCLKLTVVEDFPAICFLRRSVTLRIEKRQLGLLS